MDHEWIPDHAVVTMVELQSRSKRRYNIYINDEYAFSLHEDIMMKHQLFKGAVVDPTSIEAVMLAEERHGAYLRALRLLARRPHGERELRRKLEASDCGGEAIDYAIERLLSEGYLNDNAFAKQVVEQRITLNRKGRLFVRQELKQKGIGKEDIAQAMESVNPDAEYKAALQLASRKWSGTGGTAMDKKRKTVAFLMRRGFPQSLAFRAVREAASDAQSTGHDYADDRANAADNNGFDE